MQDEPHITDMKVFVSDTRQNRGNALGEMIPLEHTQEIDRDAIKRMLASQAGQA